MADRHNSIRIMKRKRLYLHKMRRVLAMEKMWLKEVRYQFAYSIREQAFNGLKTFVKYQKVKRLYKDNRYVAFLN